ncbi:phosphorylase superfamily domain-containing protein [Phthorimaea operculella]|nr:phosphorylase superfamily domain-containing protein [Phthorimaea operculella]
MVRYLLKYLPTTTCSSDVNYRANIWALKQVGCTHVLATTATGSLVEEYKPGDLVILDDFIDSVFHHHWLAGGGVQAWRPGHSG